MAKKNKKSHYREVYNHYRKMGYSPERARRNAQGCYIATAVYGSYDCPQVWVLRRFRDNQLSHTWYGRIFIKVYYATSPTIVKIFGSKKWFNKLFKHRLDIFVNRLRLHGIDDSPYHDSEEKNVIQNE